MKKKEKQVAQSKKSLEENYGQRRCPKNVPPYTFPSKGCLALMSKECFASSFIVVLPLGQMEGFTFSLPKPRWRPEESFALKQ